MCSLIFPASLFRIVGLRPEVQEPKNFFLRLPPQSDMVYAKLVSDLTPSVTIAPPEHSLARQLGHAIEKLADYRVLFGIGPSLKT